MYRRDPNFDSYIHIYFLHVVFVPNNLKNSLFFNYLSGNEMP